MTDVVKTSIALCSADQKRFLLAEIKGLSYYRLPQKKPAPGEARAAVKKLREFS